MPPRRYSPLVRVSMVLAGLAWLPMGTVFLYLGGGPEGNLRRGAFGIGVIAVGVLLIGTGLAPHRPKRFEDERP